MDKSYSEQLEIKKKYVNEQLMGYASVDGIMGMENPYHYRNKVHAVISREKPKAGKKGKIIAGIYEEESHKVVAVEECLLHDEYANEIIRSITDIMTKGKFEPYDEDRQIGNIRHVLIRRGHVSKETMVVIVTGTKIFPGNKNFTKELLKRHPDITTIVHNINDRKTSMVLGKDQKVLYGKGYIHDTLCGLTFRISPKSFYQINSLQTEVLYGKAMEFAGLTGNETVIDAYCGIGTISMVASKHAGRVIGVELNSDAVRDAKVNAKLNNISNVEFFNDDAGKFMERTTEKIDVVCIDPPRSGSDDKFLKSLMRLSPNKVVYVSCNPETQRRDIEKLVKGGYKVEKACGVDMFPGTGHVETVILLSRKVPDAVIEINLEMSELDVTSVESKATYKEIAEYVKNKYDLKVSNLYIAQVKQEFGLIERINYNVGEGKAKVPQVTPEKREAIIDALKYYQMI